MKLSPISPLGKLNSHLWTWRRFDCARPWGPYSRLILLWAGVIFKDPFQMILFYESALLKTILIVKSLSFLLWIWLNFWTSGHLDLPRGRLIALAGSGTEGRPFKCVIPATDYLIPVRKVRLQTLIWSPVLPCHYEICISFILYYDLWIKIFMPQEFTCFVWNHPSLLYCVEIMLILREEITVHCICLCSRFLFCFWLMLWQHYIAGLAPTS